MRKQEQHYVMVKNLCVSVCKIDTHTHTQRGTNRNVIFQKKQLQVRVSRDVMFDESASWYIPSTPDLNSNPSSKDAVSKAEMPPDEHEIGALEESRISFRLSGPNERLSRFDQSDEESASSVDSVVHSPRRKPRRWLTRKEKGKKKMPEYGMDRNKSDRYESDSEESDDGPS